MTPHPIRVAVVNHRAMFRSRFKHLMEVACDCYDQWNADIVVLDLSMPGIGGLETLRRLRKHDRKARILVTSNHEDLSHPRRALRAGAAGYLSARSAREDMVEAVRQVVAGKLVIEPYLAQQLFTLPGDGGYSSSPLDQLSEREFDYFMKLVQGLTVAQMAAQMGVAADTAERHFHHIKRKLGVRSQAEMVHLAYRAGIADA